MWYRINGQQVLVQLKVKPNARCSALLRIDEQELYISLQAKPQQDQANKALIAYLAKLLHLPKRDIVLLRGSKSRFKQVAIPLTDTVQKFIDNPNDFKQL